MNRVDPYEGISDQETAVLEGIYGDVYGPQLIVVLYALFDAALGTATWAVGHYEFRLGGEIFWVGFVIGIFFEAFYWFRILREAYSHPWIDLTYRILENPDPWFVNEFMFSIKELGRTSAIAAKAGDKYGLKAIQPNATQGDYVYEITFTSNALPIMILHSHKKFEELCSFKGGWSVIIHRNFFFTVTDITALSVVRVDWDKDDLHPFIPIVVPTDYSNVVNEVKAGATTPPKHDSKELEETREVYDKHYRTLYYNNWQLEMAQRKKLEQTQENVDKYVARRTGIILRRLKKAGQLDTGTSLSTNLFTRRNIIGTVILLAALVVIALLLKV